MTNAGSHTWGLEFDAKDLVKSIKSHRTGKISLPNIELNDFELPQRLNPKSIGIITGNGPDSGIALWESINRNIVEILGPHFIGDISLPRVQVISVPAMGLSMELDQREEVTWEALSEAVIQLKNQNVELLALACHTTHYYSQKIKEIFQSNEQEFISMSDLVCDYVEKKWN